MNEADCFLVELAYSMGFIPNDDADGVSCTDEQLIAFARRLIECTEEKMRKGIEA